MYIYIHLHMLLFMFFLRLTFCNFLLRAKDSELFDLRHTMYHTVCHFCPRDDLQISGIEDELDVRRFSIFVFSFRLNTCWSGCRNDIFDNNVWFSKPDILTTCWKGLGIKNVVKHNMSFNSSYMFSSNMMVS